ncbi:hypothetical protein EO244_14435 [Ancylomarina salipaludis]|uniref:TonB-dependent receptor plug domain-containing protein n=1 Tax=Ancylomarina salipaludis TaxID=2501299 RepID=A0A4Q1JIV7_9BACT|nr:TonB-dependent receptor plug domain-containing protein [Ancylomarina salipaludis]RXQ89022.1 hypothetical protein EO244_14435 [Ancylomarina salipaludis]
MSIRLINFLLGILIFPSTIFAFNSVKSDMDFAKSHEKDSISNFKGSILKSEAFNKGSFISFEDLLFGKVSGLLITPENGSPGQFNQLSMRGQSRITDNVNPLIIIDGIPLYFSMDIPGIENNTINSISNIINVSDIESIQVLKDVAAAAVYGNDAYNGAILITTKQAGLSNKTKVRFISKTTLSYRSNSADMISANEFRSLIKEDYPNEIKYLGNANTDWQDVIHQTGVGTDQHLSIDGNIKDTPYRVSAGYTKRNGVVKTTEFQRKSFGISGRKLFLNNYLSLNLKLNASKLKNTFADPDAFYCALSADPTQALYDNSGDYNYELYDYNPLAYLKQRSDKNKLDILSAQLGFKYSLPFLPKLNITGQVSIDKEDADRNGFANNPEVISSSWYEKYRSEVNYKQNMRYYNLGLDYLFQSHNKKNLLLVNVSGEIIIFERDLESRYESKSRNSLMFVNKDYKRKAFILSADYSYGERLSINYIYRQEKEYNDDFDFDWQYTKSLGFVYSLIKQKQFSEFDFVNDISLKGSYGKSGDVDEDLYWANIISTETLDFELYFSLFSKRLLGKIEWYNRENESMMNISSSAPSGYTIHYNYPYTIRNKGWEFSLLADLIDKNNFSWNLDFNLSRNNGEVVKFPEGLNSHYEAYKAYNLNRPLNSFYLMKQVYDDNGNPVQDLYVDDYKKFIMGSSIPKLFWGLSSNFEYKRWALNFTVRANSGGYTFSRIDRRFSFPSYPFQNVSRSYLNKRFVSDNYSDYYLHNSSFLHLENISLTYNANNIFPKHINAKFYLVGQNLKTWTSYKGLNPDTQDGIDYNNYPRPRTITLGVELYF